MRILVLLTFIFASILPSFNLCIAAEYQTPYQEAVPKFIEEVSTAVKDVVNLEDIEQWEQQLRGRFPEFLTDLSNSAQALSDQSFFEYDLEGFEVLLSKWDSLIKTYPQLDEVSVVVKPIIDKYLAGLPQLRAHKPTDVPNQNLSELYSQMEKLGPFGVGSFFHIEPLPDSQREISVNEILDEKTTFGIKKNTITRRESTITENDVVVMYELIKDGKVIEKMTKQKDRTLIHETLRKMKENNEDPKVIVALECLVKIIDEGLGLLPQPSGPSLSASQTRHSTPKERPSKANKNSPIIYRAGVPSRL